MGAVSALGHDCEANWAAARDGLGAIAVQPLDAGKYAPPFQPMPMALVEPGIQEKLEAKLARRVGALDPSAIYALTAVHEALSGAGLSSTRRSRNVRRSYSATAMAARTRLRKRMSATSE